MAVTITSQAVVEGLHRWPDAPDRRAYLRDLHRHRFIVEATVAVGHDERDVEYHDLADMLYRLMGEMGREYHPQARLVDFGARSCEAMARQVLGRLSEEGLSVVAVVVSEDGEHSARVAVGDQ